ncbi:ATP-binding protein [Jatrophihabitans fulvus]
MSLLVVTGPPGAGKSTVARLLASDTSPSALVTGDTFFTFLHRGGIDPWRPEAEQQNIAVTRSSAAAVAPLADAMDVVLDGIVGPWYLLQFTAAVGRPFDYVVLLPDEATCLHRIANRTGHGFSDADAARHMHRQFTGARVDARHVITDPPGRPSEVAALVRHRRADGRLRVTP